MKNTYAIRDREAGNIIETHIPTEAMAKRIIKRFEKIDKKGGTYKPDFYEIAPQSEISEDINPYPKHPLNPENSGKQPIVEGFTGGEWKIVPISDCCLTIQIDGFREDKKGGYIAEIKWSRDAGGVTKEDYANARLIAEAKNMYSLIRQLSERVEHLGNDLPKSIRYYGKMAKEILTRINKVNS